MHRTRQAPLLLVLALPACTTEKLREEYGPIQDLGLEVVSSVERDSDFLLRSAAVFGTAAFADPAAAEADTLADDPIWPFCVVRSSATSPWTGLVFQLSDCPVPLAKTATAGSWRLGFVLENGALHYNYGVDGEVRATVAGETILGDGAGTITESSSTRIVTWTGNTIGTDEPTGVVSVDATLDIEVEPDTGCRTFHGTAEGNRPSGGHVTVTFDGYHVCRYGNDVTACPSGALQLEAVNGTVDVELDGTPTATASAGVYGDTFELTCMP
jgi:hypothetical protein